MSTTTNSQPEPTTEPSSGSTTPEDSITAKSSTEPAQETTSQPAEDQAPETKPDNREAAKYRVRLREAETQRDALSQRLESVTTNAIESKLEALSIGTRALKAAGVDLTSLYDEDGAFSDELLLLAVEETHEKLGLPKDHTLDRVLHTYQTRGRIRWSGPGAGVVPSAGTGGERPITSGWNNVINSR